MFNLPPEKAHISPETDLGKLVQDLIERFDNAAFIIFGYQDDGKIKTAMSVKGISNTDALRSFIETAASLSKKI